MRAIGIIIFALCISATVVAQHNVTFTVRNGPRTEIRISIDDANPLPHDVVEKLKRASSYRLSEQKKVAADFPWRLQTALAAAKGVANEEARKTALADVALKAADELGQPASNLIDTGVNPNDARRIDLKLTQPLEFGKTYELIINGLDSNENPALTRLAIAMDSSAEIKGPLNFFSRDEISIRSKTNPVLYSDNVTVKVRTLRLKADATGVEEKFDTIGAQRGIDSIPPNQLTLKLDERLDDNRTYDLIVEGLTDGSAPIKSVKGRIKFPGLPAPPDDPAWDINFSTEAAVAQKPQFNLTAKINPRSPGRLDHTGWLWQPQATIDVGLGDTKSNNAITFYSPFVRSFVQPRYQARPDEPPSFIDVRESQGKQDKAKPARGTIPHYKDWSDLPWLHLSDVLFSVGPKIETDRKFQRINTLGSAQFEFRFPRLMGTIKARRELLKKDMKHKDDDDNDADIVVLKHGFSFVPYLSFDFGGHANNETVSKKVNGQELTLLIPRHAIFRNIAGFKASIEWQTFFIPTTLSFDNSATYMATTEKIGYSTDDGVFLRQLKGFQPHFKTSLDFAFDPAKHYSFNVAWENGRQPPNFEYLNKLTTGLKILY